MLLLISAVLCARLCPWLWDQIYNVRIDLKSKRQHHARLREEWRDLMTHTTETTSSSHWNDTVPDYLMEEEAALKKEVLELSKIVSELKPIKHETLD